MSKKLKIVFAGTPEFALPSLKSLANESDFLLQAVYTQPDRPVGRGQRVAATPIKIYAEEQGLLLRQPSRLDQVELDFLRELKPDIFVVVAYGLMLPEALLSLPRLGCLNLHASLLPKYRGASPIQAVLLAGESVTGVTFMQITKSLDSGPILFQIPIPTEDKTAEELFIELSELGARHFPSVLRQLAEGKLFPVPQEEAQANYCHKIEKKAGLINWQEDSAEILMRKLKAYTPWPGLWTNFQGKVLKLVDFEPGATQSNFPVAQVFQLDDKICVQTKTKALVLKKVQIAGKKISSAEEFTRGYPDFIGSNLT